MRRGVKLNDLITQAYCVILATRGNAECGVVLLAIRCQEVALSQTILSVFILFSSDLIVGRYSLHHNSDT